MPLLKAVGTAAASVGMPLVGRSSLTSWLHQGKQKQTGEPVVDSANGDVGKGVLCTGSDPFVLNALIFIWIYNIGRLN